MNDNKKLKIAMLGHKRIPSREGGVEIVVEELSVHMASKGHQVTCYNRSGHHVSGKEYDEDNGLQTSYRGVNLKYVPTVPGKGLAAFSASFFASVLAARGNYDVVHFHAEGPCIMMWIPKLFAGKKCIATIHGLDHRRAKWGGFAKRIIKIGEWMAVKMADEIIVLSHDMEVYFLKGYRRKTTFIPNGVEEPTLRDADLITREYGLTKDSYILALSRLAPEKGIRYLIDAYKKIDTDKKLVIAGGSSDTEDFVNEMKKRASDDDRIIFTDFVQGQMLEELYSNPYIYVLASDIEGMPLSLLEAMSYGNCVLTSNIPECTEVVEDKGFSFARGSTIDLEKKLRMLLDSPEAVAAKKRVSKDFILSKYSWDEVVAKTLELYTKDMK
jgi:glycosyltransferase involved in cell wall biosynthesis